jgi:DNA modification methylase
MNYCLEKSTRPTNTGKLALTNLLHFVVDDIGPADSFVVLHNQHTNTTHPTFVNTIVFGNCLDTIPKLVEQGVRVQTCVTSPPYFGLRDYGHEGQLGLEPTPEEYVANIVKVFQSVRDLLTDDGTLWLNLGDSYWNHSPVRKSSSGAFDKTWTGGKISKGERRRANGHPTLKMKDLIGIPWRVAFALQADGWFLRQDIIWNKPNPMPEPARDRFTKAHEYIFLLSKSSKYRFDRKAIPKPIEGRGFESVWTVATKPYKGAHFATFPPALIEPCILAGSRSGDVVFDPFMGSGTTAATALRLGRQYLGCELNPEYEPLQQERIASAVPPQAELFGSFSAPIMPRTNIASL